MIGRFFLLSGAVLRVNPVRVLVRIWIIAAVLSLTAAVILSAFPETFLNLTADAFESTILTHGTLEEVEMLREIRQERSR